MKILYQKELDSQYYSMIYNQYRMSLWKVNQIIIEKSNNELLMIKDEAENKTPSPVTNVVNAGRSGMNIKNHSYLLM